MRKIGIVGVDFINIFLLVLEKDNFEDESCQKSDFTAEKIFCLFQCFFISILKNGHVESTVLKKVFHVMVI